MTQLATEKAFVDAYDSYADAIFRYCLFRVEKKEVAEDLTQEIFMKAWKYLANGNEVKTMQSFLYRLAKNSVIDHYRKRKSDISIDVLKDNGFEPSIDIRNAISDAIETKRVIEKINELPPKYRDVISMQLLDGLKPKAISLILETSPSIVSVRIHRAKIQLRNLLKYEK